MTSEPDNQVLAEVMLRNPEGPSLAAESEPITAHNVTRFYSPTEIQGAAAQRLEALGFDVVDRSPLGLTICGDKGLFERVFQTQLAPGPAGSPPAAPLKDQPVAADAEDVEAPAPVTRDQTHPSAARATATAGPAAGSPPGWVATPPMVLPRSLQDVVDEVVLPVPMSFHDD